MPRAAKLAFLTVHLLLAVAVWRVFFPALMSADSMAQFRQAWTGAYDNWHPPLMAVVLHGFFRLGRSIGAVTLLQCLGGLFGLRALILASLEAIRPEVTPLRAEGIAVAVALLLLTPLSPLPFYLAVFWKDTWAAVLMLWLCAAAFRLLGGKGRAGLQGAALVVLAALLGMVRHNAIVVLPFAGLVLAWRFRRPRMLAVALLALPLLASLAGEALLDRAFQVQDVHLERQMMAFDLVGVCALEARTCEPFLENRRERYVPGDLHRSLWADPPPLEGGALDGDRLESAYLDTAREHPLLLARVKLESFAPLLGLEGAHIIIYSQLDANELGLQLNERFAGLRTWLAAATRGIAAHPVWRLISGVHLVWIVANVLWIAALRRRVALAFLLPLSFTASYLLAAPAHDYRFLYPSTLAVQGVTLAWLMALASSAPWFSRNHS